MVWIEFILASGIVIFAGSRLAYVGDKLGDVMGWERTWVGLLLLSFSTSLPELFTSIGATGVLNQPDLALGNNLGSVAFNLFIISILDFMKPGAFTYKLDPRLLFSGVFSLLIMMIFAFFLINPLNFGLWNIGADTFIIFLVYIAGMRLTFLHEHKNTNKKIINKKKKKEKSLKLWLSYIVLALIILSGGLWLAKTGERISEITGISRSFVGALFLAFATSLPELSTTTSCIRMGLPDMAVGNLLGANLQNLAIPFIADIFFRKGYLLSHVSHIHIITLLMGGILTSLLLLGIIYRSQKHFLRMGWDTILMALVYLTGMFFVFKG